MAEGDACNEGAELRLTDVCVRFGPAEILRIDSLMVAAGEVVSVVGPSGCGKSTLLRILARLLEPASGQVDVRAAEPGRRVRTGFVFQDAVLLPWRTADANIRLPGELERSPVSTARVHQLADLAGLSRQDLQKRPDALSGGMKMRVSLARALALEPDLLLLDEPFAAVDDLLRHQLQLDVLRIRQELGLTVVLVTHNVEEAVSMSDRVMTLGGSPASVVDVTSVDLDRTADIRGTAEFARHVGAVLAALRQSSGR